MAKIISSVIDNLDVHYYSQFYDKNEADAIFSLLESKLIYNSDEMSKIIIFGKEQKIPRKQVAYGDEGTGYSFSGTRITANSWNEDNDVCKILKEIKTKVESITNRKFNFVLINRYSNGNEYIGYHRDDEKELGDEPDVIGVSFGAARTFKFRAYNFFPKELSKEFEIELVHGSMVCMYHPTNKFWAHSIPKRTKITKPRISLTFRHIHIPTKQIKNNTS